MASFWCPTCWTGTGKAGAEGRGYDARHQVSGRGTQDVSGRTSRKGKGLTRFIGTRDNTARQRNRIDDVVEPYACFKGGMAAEDELRRLGIELPSPPKPVATYIPAVRVGELVFLCGVIPVRDGMLAFSGKLGRDLLVSQGYAAARVALLNALAILRAEVGTLDRVKKVVRMVGYVASGEGFGEQPAVINGASDLLVEVFAEAGRHARVAVGVAELPLNAPVELELIVQVD